jgi:hypothetical protein
MDLSSHVPNRRLGVWMGLLITVTAALAIVFVPAWLILPFKAQTSEGVSVSYVLRGWSPWLTPPLLGISLVLAVILWRGAWRWVRRPMLVIAVLLVGVATWFARQNHFEWMFKPLVQSSFSAAPQNHFIGDHDMVMALAIAGDAVAYPVRQMAYHHVVQDTVGGVPLVATY